MSLDRRKIQTAVVGDPNSAEPAYMPQDQDEALAFKQEAQEQELTFWCGALLGGCGQRLSLKIYTARDTIPHFAHLAGAGRCGRDHLGGSSADHLYAHRGLSRWLGTQGHTQHESLSRDRIMADGRACTQLLIPNPAPDHLPWRLVFDAAGDAELFQVAASEEARTCQWLLLESESDPNASLRRVLVGNKVRFQRFRLRSQGAARVMDIGEVTPTTGEITWTPLEEHVLSGGALRRPHTTTENASPESTSPAAPTNPTPRPASRDAFDEAVEALRRALAARDRSQVHSQMVRLKQLMATRPVKPHEMNRVRALVDRATSMLAEASPSPEPAKPRRTPSVVPASVQTRRAERRRRKNHKNAQQRDERERRRSAQEQLSVLDHALQADDMVDYAEARAELELMLHKLRTPEDVKDTIRARLARTPEVSLNDALEERNRWLGKNVDSLISRLRRCEAANDRPNYEGILGELRRLRSQRGISDDLAARIDDEVSSSEP